MRKILLTILTIALIICMGFFIAKGLDIGEFSIWGVQEISEENDTIDEKNQRLTDLSTTGYESAITKLNNQAEELQTTKSEYENKAVLVENSSAYMQTEEYEIEFLWTKLGNYAKDEGVQIKIDVTNSTTEGLYDLNFTISGKYVNVTDFIYDIENDSKLGFKIEDFKMTSGDGGVQGTFSCKEININLETVDVSTSTEETEEDTESTETTDNTTTSNSTETENTTSTTNDTSSTNTDIANEVLNSAGE